MSAEVGEPAEQSEIQDLVQRDSYAVGQIEGQAVAVGAGALAQINQYTEIIVKLDTIEDLPPAPGEPPFKGLAYFTEADAGIYFGREDLSKELAARIQNDKALAVIGASGSGKSSLLRAGIVPRLRAQNWAIQIITPTADPLDSLATMLTLDDDDLEAADKMRAQLAKNSRALHLAANKLAARQNKAQHLLLVDQFEELFTLCKDEDQRVAFLENLLKAVSSGGKTALLIGLRADFYDHALQYEGLRKLLANHQEPIGPMEQEELVRVIAEPAKRGGWQFVEGLVEQILEDIGREPGRLPLLSHALLETWERRRGTVMTLAGYRAAGGVEGAIAKTAEDTLKLLKEDQLPIVQHIFLSLTELGEGAEDTRRRATQAELALVAGGNGQVNTVLEQLVRARLVTLDGENAEVAHEALIRRWPRLHNWLQENRERLRFQRQLAHDAGQYFEELKEDPDALYRGARLAQALEWLEDNEVVLDERSHSFLDRSREAAEAREREIEEQRQRELAQQRALAEEQRQRAEEAETAEKRQRRLTRIAVGVLGVALIAAIFAVFFGLQSKDNASLAQVNATEAAFNLATAEFNEQQAFDEGTRAAANAAEAIANEQEAFAQGTIAAGNAATAEANAEQAQEESIRAENNLSKAQEQQRLAEARELAARSAAIIDDDYTQALLWAYQALQKTFAIDQTTTFEGYNSLQTALTRFGRPLAVLQHQSGINSAAFSADSKLIITASWDGTARLWNLEGKLLAVLEGHTAEVNSAAFSPNGQRIVTASSDKTARLWDSEGHLLEVLEAHSGSVYSAAFSPDGQHIITVGCDEYQNDSLCLSGSARLWDSDGQPLIVLEEQLGDIYLAEFSPNGERIITAGADGTARIWDLEGNPVIELEGHTGPVSSASFSTDGERIITSSKDGTVRLWSNEGQSLMVLNWNAGSANSALFSPDGQHILTAIGGKGQLWDEDGNLLVIFGGESAGINLAAFSPDGHRIITTGGGTAHIWDDHGNSLAILDAHEGIKGFLGSALFSPDGKRILTAGWDGTARLWDGEGQPLAILEGSISSVHSAFSADGARIVTVSSNSKAWLYDGDGHFLRMLDGHTDWINLAVFSPTGDRILTTSRDRTARLWDREGRPLSVLEGHTETVFSGEFSQDGKYIVTVSRDGTARIWDLEGNSLVVLDGYKAGILLASFSPDGQRIITVGCDEKNQENLRCSFTTVKLWDIKGELLTTFKDDSGLILSAVFSADGKRILTASSDGTARLWDKNGEPLTLLEGHRGSVNSVVFSPDSSRIVTAGADGTARLWDIAGQLLAVMEGHTGPVWSVAFSPDGETIVTVSGDKTARLWDRDGHLLANLIGHTGTVWSAAFNGNGGRIITGSNDETARLWRVFSNASDMLSEAEKTLITLLDEETCIAEFGEERCLQ